MSEVLGYLAQKNTPPPRTLQYAYAQGPVVVLRGGAFSHERSDPVLHTVVRAESGRARLEREKKSFM